MRHPLAVCVLLALAAAARAELACDKPEHDAGRVRGGVALVHRFVLTNTGKETIQIGEPKTGCGCLRAAVERQSLSPGETTSVSVEIHTVTQAAGANDWRVLVPYVMPGQQGAVLLRIKGEVIPEVSITPASLVISTEGPLSHALTLIDRCEKPLEVRGASASSPHVKATVSEPVKCEQGRKRTIGLEVGSRCPEGRQELVLVVYTADPSCPEMKVPFTLVKRPARGTTASPAEVDWQGKPGDALPSKIVLLDCGEEEVRVESVECDNPVIRCTFAAGPGPRATLRVVCDQVPAGGLKTTLRVHLQGPKPSVVTVPVSIAP